MTCECRRAGSCGNAATHSATYPNGAVYLFCQACVDGTSWHVIVRPLDSYRRDVNAA